MPIEFHCPECNQFLRTPDGTEGKNAKCPKCGALVMVPVAAAPPPPAPVPGPMEENPFAGIGDPSPGAGDDNPFAGIGESSGPTAPPLDPENPYAPPSLVSDYPTGPSSESGRDGPPWEREGKSFDTFWRTTKEVFGEPNLMFRRMRRIGGISNPFWFACLGGMVGAFASMIYQLLMQGALVAIMGAGGGGGLGPEEAGMMMGQSLCFSVLGLVFTPVIIIIALLVGAGITHLMLMIVGGERQPFETTFRVYAYAYGATALFALIPLCGGYLQWIVNLVYVIIGVAAAHETSGGKAALAVLLPTLLCLALTVAVVFAFGAAFFAGFGGGFPM